MKQGKLDRAAVLKLCKALGVIAVCAIAFAYAVVYILHQGRFEENYSPDESHYIAMAQRLLTEGVYSYWGDGPDAYVSPGYPIFLTLCMAVFGTDVAGIDAIKFVQAFLSAGTVFLTFFLGWRLTKKYSVGILAAMLLAANGIYALYAKRLLTETFFCFTMMLFFAVFLVAVERGRWWLHLLSGALFCVTIFVRPLLLMTLPVLYIPLLLQCWRSWKNDPRQTRFPWKRLLTPVGCFVAGVLVVGLPWWIRNVVSLGDFVLLATQTNPLYAGLAWDPEALGLEDPGSMLGNVALLFQLLFTRPLETLHWMIFEKFDIIFMRRVDYVVYLVTITTLVKDVTLYLGLLGAARGLFSKRLRWFTAAFGLYFLSIFLFVPTARYGLQYYPLLAVFAGYVLVLLFRGTEDAGIFSRWKPQKGREDASR